MAYSAVALCSVLAWGPAAAPSMMLLPQRYGVMSGLGPLSEGGPNPLSRSPLPGAFDARTAFPGCVHRVLDQGQCGSCWSFAATEALSDRFCIRSHGLVNVTLSPGDLLSCEKLNLGCTMGSLPEWAWAYLQSDGVRTEACIPYSSETGHTQPCDKNKTGCTGSSASDSTHYHAANFSHCGAGLTGAARVRAIQACLLGGPVDATFNVVRGLRDLRDWHRARADPPCITPCPCLLAPSGPSTPERR